MVSGDFQLTIRDDRKEPGSIDRRLRMWLKRGLRSFGIRCVTIRPGDDEKKGAPSEASGERVSRTVRDYQHSVPPRIAPMATATSIARATVPMKAQSTNSMTFIDLTPFQRHPTIRVRTPTTCQSPHRRMCIANHGGLHSETKQIVYRRIRAAFQAVLRAD